MRFKDKTIFIISYENWGGMLMSKHHYAIELAKMGNEVYFINHADRRNELKRGEIVIGETNYPGLRVIRHRMLHPYFLKFKWRALYNLLVRSHIGRIIKKVGKSPDIVWTFDSGNTLPLRYFGSGNLKIFMPVDGPFYHEHELSAAMDANLVISVTREIIGRFANLQKPTLLLKHGVASVFLDKPISYETGNPIRVGYSGSLIRSDLDIPVFLAIVKKHPEVVFEFWGEYNHKKSNIHLPQDVEASTLKFIAELQRFPNVVLHGAVNAETLAKGLGTVDAFIICYNIKNCQNSHKVLEYLSTGKVIVSNHLTAYEGDEDRLIEMVESTQDNVELPSLFDKVIKNLQFYNSRDKQDRRRAHAELSSYTSNISVVEKELTRLKY